LVWIERLDRNELSKDSLDILAKTRRHVGNPLQDYDDVSFIPDVEYGLAFIEVEDRFQEIDHRLGQGATKAMAGGCLMGVYLIGVDLMGVYLIGVDLMGVYLIGAYLTGAFISRVCTS
jgi:uncharacterized protein YjbI with pentapeptide repeats